MNTPLDTPLFPPGPGDFSLFLTFIAAIILFLAYWLLIDSPKVVRSFNEKFGDDRGSLFYFIFNKGWGAILFGITAPAAVFIIFPGLSLPDLGFKFFGPRPVITLIWISILCPLAVLSAWLGARKKTDFGRYPEIRKKSWTPGTIIVHVSGWSIYLLAYELFFRGVLIFPVMGLTGPWAATGINAALYSAAHVPKGAGEAVGALFLGILLSLLTIYTGTIWIAFFTHLALALPNGLFAFHYRRDTHLLSPKRGRN